MYMIFNALIVDAKKKPIIALLEELRLFMIERLYSMKFRGQYWGNQICIGIRDSVNNLKNTS